MIFGYPNNLYKYRQLNEHSRLILSDNIIYFASPQEFNDPFDCSIPFKFDLTTKASVFQFYYQHEKLLNPRVKDSRIRKRVKELYNTNQHKNPLFIKNINSEILNSIRDGVGIFSLTPDYNSLLMWSHYANSHKGFCICFNVKILLKYSLIIRRTYNKGIALFKVEYSNDYPVINLSLLLHKDEKIPNILTKSFVWSYEKEYRLILLDGAKNEVELPKGAIKRVILGCQISSTDKSEIISILKKKNENIYLYQAMQLDDKYGLSFEHINYK